MFNVKPYNTCGCYPNRDYSYGGGGISVIDTNTVLLFDGGPAKITVTIPELMKVKLALVWENSVGMNEMFLIDTDDSALLTINEEFITVPLKDE